MKLKRMSVCGILFGIIPLVLFNLPAFAAKKNSYVLCKNKKIVRTIRVLEDDAGRCKTTYTKSGIDRVIGTARHQKGCFSFLENVKENLEKAKWKCRDISHAKLDKNPQKSEKSVQ